MRYHGEPQYLKGGLGFLPDRCKIKEKNKCLQIFANSIEGVS
jgi:hypothetical protein